MSWPQSQKQMKDFGKTLGKVKGRPHWFPTPGFALKVALGGNECACT